MLPFNNLLPIDRRATAPVYQQIAHGLIHLIRNGILRPGASLPSSRDMSRQLGVHRKTVVAAYQELFAQDWIDTQPRKGVYISERLPEIKPRSFKATTAKTNYDQPAQFNFQRFEASSTLRKTATRRLIIDDGFPDARMAPIDTLMKTYRRLAPRQAFHRMSMYGPAAGSENLRTAIACFLSGTRGISIKAENVLVSSGAQMAIYMAARLVLTPGSTVIVGEPGYFMANRAFEQFGAKLVRVPVDEYGIDVQAIEKICRKKKPALLYIIPHHHHPTTVTLSADRRMKLLQLVQQYKLPVIEDDYDYDFHYSSTPILPLASANHGGNVIYVGSLAKSMASHLRVGYMVATADFIEQAGNLKKLAGGRVDNILEESLAELFSQGDFHRHLKKSVKLYHERRDLLSELLQQELGDVVDFDMPDGGMAIWTRFNKKYPLAHIAGFAAARGLLMSDGSIYNTSGTDHNALRFGFASLNPKEMEESISIIKKALC
ncbi:MAG TPA: PLP-dependent aminotransferase family protein [Chitinophagaceae bacterium]|nr:PLP-dependent aminotransferase family protein [Chitinophagaceae bacterium]